MASLTLLIFDEAGAPKSRDVSAFEARWRQLAPRHDLAIARFGQHAALYKWVQENLRRTTALALFGDYESLAMPRWLNKQGLLPLASAVLLPNAIYDMQRLRSYGLTAEEIRPVIFENHRAGLVALADTAHFRLTQVLTPQQPEPVVPKLPPLSPKFRALYQGYGFGRVLGDDIDAVRMILGKPQLGSDPTFAVKILLKNTVRGLDALALQRELAELYQVGAQTFRTHSQKPEAVGIFPIQTWDRVALLTKTLNETLKPSPASGASPYDNLQTPAPR